MGGIDETNVAERQPIEASAFREVRTPADGSCLFHALEHGAALLSKGEGTGPRLRKALCSHMRQNSSLQVGGIPLATWIFWDSRLSVTQYVSAMGKAAAWGGGIELAAFAAWKGVCVEVYERVSRQYSLVSMFGNRIKPRVRVIFKGGRHYEGLELRKPTAPAGPARVQPSRQGRSAPASAGGAAARPGAKRKGITPARGDGPGAAPLVQRTPDRDALSDDEWQDDREQTTLNELSPPNPLSVFADEADTDEGSDVEGSPDDAEPEYVIDAVIDEGVSESGHASARRASSAPPRRAWPGCAPTATTSTTGSGTTWGGAQSGRGSRWGRGRGAEKRYCVNKDPFLRGGGLAMGTHPAPRQPCSY